MHQCGRLRVARVLGTPAPRNEEQGGGRTGAFLICVAVMCESAAWGWWAVRRLQLSVRARLGAPRPHTGLKGRARRRHGRAAHVRDDMMMVLMSTNKWWGVCVWWRVELAFWWRVAKNASNQT